MQAAIENVQFSTTFNTVNTIDYLLKKVETSDAKLRNEIENKIVSLWQAAVSDLVRNLVDAQGVKRSVVAMSLIRIGRASLQALKNELLYDNENNWVIRYVINEIQGSNEALAV